MIPELGPDSPLRPRKPHALPVKFVGLDDDDLRDNKPKKVLPRSPMPNRHSPRAPLADLLDDFAGQEKAARDERMPENLLKDTLEPTPIDFQAFFTLDQRNANLVLKCSRPSCIYNKPTITQKLSSPNSSYSRPTLCTCGSPMTRVPATPTTTSCGFTMSPPPAIITPGTAPSPISNSRPITENCLITDDLNNGPTSLRDIDDLLFADHSPSEETRLLDRTVTLSRSSKYNS